MTRNKVLLHIKDFLKILFLKLLTILITKMHGLTHFLLDLLPTHGFSIGEKNLKKNLQTGFRNGGSFLELLKIFFVLKFANLLITSKLTMKVFSLMEITIHSLSVLNLESLGFFVGTLLPIISCLHLIPSIWLGNSKSNGGQPSKFPNLKPLSLSKNGLIPKSPNPRSPQKLRYLLGPILYHAHLLGPKLLPKILFLQVRPTKPISKGPRTCS